ncbi:hypothetical protein [Caldalkalibacillus salinus]|uniref:lysine 5,6-aminomutase reactivase subunit KamB n=1 Tax=Caldalkalibacillus salinus TaxID=2803787 RepID=UPI001923810E|nr:hypothetical protein [Caldalkalibacillus salinus]
MTGQEVEGRAILLPHIPSGMRRIAVVGLAKNVGKTTVLNQLIAEASQRHKRILITSIGVDGEQKDVWDHHQKPRIYISTGHYVATAQGLASASSAKFKVLKELKPTSPAGPVYLLQCIQAGYVKLGGTHHNEDLRHAQEVCESLGLHIDYIFVDGAYDRIASSQKRVADGFFLCTGAAVSPDLQQAREKTREVVMKWTIPEWQGPQPSAKKVAFKQKGKPWSITSYASALGHSDDIRRQVDRQTEALYIPGAWTERLVTAFKHHDPPFSWLMEEPSRNFLTMSSMRHWYRAGGDIFVKKRSEVLALTVSPFSMQIEAQADVWLHEMKAVAGHLPTIDVKRAQVL